MNTTKKKQSKSSLKLIMILLFTSSFISLVLAFTTLSFSGYKISDYRYDLEKYMGFPKDMPFTFDSLFFSNTYNDYSSYNVNNITSIKNLVLTTAANEIYIDYDYEINPSAFRANAFVSTTENHNFNFFNKNFNEKDNTIYLDALLDSNQNFYNKNLHLYIPEGFKGGIIIKSTSNPNINNQTHFDYKLTN